MGKIVESLMNDDETIISPRYNENREDADHTVMHSVSTINVLPIGTVLGEFKIVGLIGEGGFGIVYRAFDHSLEREVALKEYMPLGYAARESGTTVVKSGQHQETFEAGLRSFINEAKLLAKFDHPSLVKVYRFFEANNTAYMAMPLYEGSTLKDILAQRTEPPDEKWLKHILKHLLDALELIHKANCFHRDISPDNILIVEDDRPVLLDFGAARQVIKDKSHIPTAIYKPGYAPIEQCGESEMSVMKQGAWTDIYALAAVAYFALTGKKPVPAVSRVLTDPLKPLTTLKSLQTGYSQKFLNAIDKALAFRPENRPQSVEEFCKLLQLTKTPEMKGTFSGLKFIIFFALLAIGGGVWLFVLNDSTRFGPDNSNIISHNFEEAEDCLKNSQYECVIAKTENILDLDPSNEQARDLLDNAMVSYGEINRNFKEAKDCLKNVQYECAIVKLDTILALDPGNAHAKTLRENANTKRKQIITLNNSLKEAEDCLKNAKYECALNEVDAVLNLAPDNVRAKTIQADVMKKFEEIDSNIQEAEDCYKKANYKCVITKTKVVLGFDPDNAQARNLVNKTKARQQQNWTINKNLKEARDCLDKAKYECAITKSDVVLSFAPNNAQAHTILSTARTKQEEAWEKSIIE